MNFLLWIYLLSASESGVLSIEKGLRLQSIPESYGLFLQRPAGVDVDDQGKIYILDLTARAVFIWDAQGQFQTHFGEPGEGPGRFTFVGGGVSRGFLSVLKDRIYVYDGGRGVLHEFERDYTFIRSRPMRGHGGRTNYFNMTRDGAMLLFQKNYQQQPPTQELSLYRVDTLEQLKVFYAQDDRTFERIMDGERTTKVIVNAFSPAITMFCDTAKDEILVGETDKPEFSIFDSTGTLKNKVRFKPLDNTLTDEDKAEFMQSAYLRRNPDLYQVKWPQEKPFYQAVLPLKDDRFIAYSTSRKTRTITGVCVNRSGERLGRFRYECGENGGFWGAAGRVMAVQTDEDGDYIVEEVFFERD